MKLATWQEDCHQFTIVRRIFSDFVQWIPEDVFEHAGTWDYAVYRFAFVPGFHVCQIHDSDDECNDWSQILSSHKTLHEAMGLCKLLLAYAGANDGS